MTATIIDGKKVAARVRAEVAEAARDLRKKGVVPGLAVILVGDDPASQVYVRNKERACAEVGIEAFDHRLPASTSEAELLALIQRLNEDARVHGILVQLPLPKPLDAQRIIKAISPDKDVDGLHPMNVGRLWRGEEGFVPCTPAGVMRLLREAGTDLRGATAVVIGRSSLVGKPMAALLMAEDATVTMCHSKTRNLPEVVGRADVVVAAIGRPEMVQGAWIREGATVIDVGINKREDGSLVGDVEFTRAVERARAITPVPGGVGPMTIAMLLQNTVIGAQRSAGLKVV